MSRSRDQERLRLSPASGQRSRRRCAPESASPDPASSPGSSEESMDLVVGFAFTCFLSVGRCMVRSIEWACRREQADGRAERRKTR